MKKKKEIEMFKKFNNENLERMDCIIQIIRKLTELKNKGNLIEFNRKGKFEAEIMYKNCNKTLLIEKEFNMMEIQDYVWDDKFGYSIINSEHWEMLGKENVSLLLEQF